MINASSGRFFISLYECPQNLSKKVKNESLKIAMNYFLDI